MGSSRISTGGSCTIACARPTRRDSPWTACRSSARARRRGAAARTTSSSRACAVSRRELAHVGDELEERAHRHLAIARRAFGQVAEAGLGARCACVSTSWPQMRHAAGGRRHEAGEHAHGRGLARAVRAEEAEHLARLTRNVRSSTARRWPYCLVRPWQSIIGCLVRSSAASDAANSSTRRRTILHTGPDSFKHETASFKAT